MKVKNALYLVLAMTIAFAGGAYTMAQVRDWHDVKRVHDEVSKALNDMNRLQYANGFNMGGHGERAKDALVTAERELDQAVMYLQRH